MTGIELVAATRAEGIDVTALLLTGYTHPEDIIAAINQGQVYRYITKPWDVNDLRITVKNAVEFTQLRRDKERLLRQLHQRVEALGVLYEVSRASAGRAAWATTPSSTGCSPRCPACCPTTAARRSSRSGGTAPPRCGCAARGSTWASSPCWASRSPCSAPGARARGWCCPRTGSSPT